MININLHPTYKISTEDKLLMILDKANAEGRLTDIEYCQCIELILGERYNMTEEPNANWTYEELSTGGQRD